MAGFKAITGAVGAALLLAGCAQKSDTEFCAYDGDGSMVSTADGKNFYHLNTAAGDNNPSLADFVEGREGMGGGAACTSRDGERWIPMRDLPDNAVVHERGPDFKL